MLPLNVHSCRPSEAAKGLNFGLSLHLRLCFENASWECREQALSSVRDLANVNVRKTMFDSYNIPGQKR